MYRFSLQLFYKGQCKIYNITWPVEKKNCCRKICSPRMKSLQKSNCPVTFFLTKCICPVFMNSRCCIVSITFELSKDHMKGSSSPYEFLLMTDESFLQETNWEISRNLYTSLHAFLNLHDSQFCPQGVPFYTAHLILIP